MFKLLFYDIKIHLHQNIYFKKLQNLIFYMISGYYIRQIRICQLVTSSPKKSLVQRRQNGLGGKIALEQEKLRNIPFNIVNASSPHLIFVFSSTNKQCITFLSLIIFFIIKLLLIKQTVICL